MYGIAYLAVVIFWILDIMNMPFMEKFDTTYPLNTLFWILLWICIPSVEVTNKK